MSKKTAYLEKMDETLKDIDKKIERYARDAKGLAQNVAEGGRQELKNLARQRDVFGEKLEEAKRQTGETWDEIQKGLDRARVELDDALSSAKRALQKRN